ncbi:hypothetical protein XA68_13344 [Ophiocordyceps unilateralis]|uniref:Mtf2-like C-terminal domain-containing protein n=1 Tax=Ophiocordyceps unilateralis TaxID=268505 RepID=A0A2A9PBA0_OPHUN|nr:hypothetical protein XA68_13344 [Ophiocordyceps unilateralis]
MLLSLRPARTPWRQLVTPALTRLSRRAHSDRNEHQHDHAIPFDWGENNSFDGQETVRSENSTITPSEAYIFKSIFEEIATGRMPQSRRQGFRYNGKSEDQSGSDLSPRKHKGSLARSIVEQARINEFREKFLVRYPPYLQAAAKMALRMFDAKPGTPDKESTQKLTETDEKVLEEAAKYEAARTDERIRVEALMKGCATDVALWQIMEDEVFSLPCKLGIVQGEQRGHGTKAVVTAVVGAKKRGRSPKKVVDAKRTAGEDDATKGAPVKADSQKLSMDVHGPLYPHFLELGLDLFDNLFARPSPYALQILPRIKALGLCSYVLGVSTPFYVRLARIHWNRYGDAATALDVLQELSDSGLYVDVDVMSLLTQIRDNLHGCTWGAQGPFVMKMMEFPPYDGSLTRRLEKMLDEVKKTLQQDVAQ